MRVQLTTRQLHDSIRRYFGQRLDDLFAAVRILDPKSVPRLKRALHASFTQIKLKMKEADRQCGSAVELAKFQGEYAFSFLTDRIALDIRFLATLVVDTVATDFSALILRFRLESVH